MFLPFYYFPYSIKLIIILHNLFDVYLTFVFREWFGCGQLKWEKKKENFEWWIEEEKED